MAAARQLKKLRSGSIGLAGFPYKQMRSRCMTIEPHTTISDATIFHADCRDVLRQLADNSLDSIVTDPPYALVSIVNRFGKPGSAPAKSNEAYQRASAGFMGKSWDTGEVAFSEEFWAECLRVLKPGGHVVAFSGTRTYHRMAVAIEDAGFEIRDQLGWLYGSGFPKSHNQKGDWEGWGSALKPGWEPICLGRKALDGTIANNLKTWGVGALNIDGCRVAGDEITTRTNTACNSYMSGCIGDVQDVKSSYTTGSESGRWPANVVHDGSNEVIAAFPTSKSTIGKPRAGRSGDGYGMTHTGAEYNDEGSAARFFYCAKASRADRDDGLEHLQKKEGGMVSENSGQHITRREEDYKPQPRANTHPTVKPTELMRWLCRLVTPPGGTVLDPFLGSGSTGRAALMEGFKFIGCEREDEYLPIAEGRIRAALKPATKPAARKSKADPNPDQQTLFAA